MEDCGLEIEEEVAVVYFNYGTIPIFTLTIRCKYLCLLYKIHTYIWEYFGHYNKQLTLPVPIFTVVSLRTPQILKCDLRKKPGILKYSDTAYKITMCH